MSDLFISYGTYQMAQYYKHLGGNVFVYTFDHIRPKISGPLENFLPFLGASHGIETAYLFGTSNLSDFQPNLEDETLIRKFTGYFANFAKFGTPENSSKWKPITNANPLKHNVIKLHFDEIRDDFCEKRPLIWQSILEAEKCKL
jgi:carboxylesterase type B